MQILAILAVLFVAAIHVYILVLEMFLWDTPKGRQAFGTSAEFASASKVLAANQGLYNGFLAAGLIWGILRGAAGQELILFCLVCVVVAGIYGAVTASRKILYVQALPGMIALVLALLA
ncbi:DUF1304 domain-containing protein [Thiofilum flexile]|uniref:DUF1304 domain-containing protein n=1 Tax=Thiofilum flexile TaxID=125627 RepID=UPI00037086A4|nr:DUF1304 domain-containing protein [Thiofilum flexile]